MPIVEKYNSEFAVFYKDKLIATCEGKPWTMPPIGSKKPAPPKPRVQNGPSQISGGFNGPNQISGGFNGPSQISGGFNGPSQISGGPAKPFAFPDKAQNEAFFARKGNENASRPENLPPSQGGKYGGFGNPNCISFLSS